MTEVLSTELMEALKEEISASIHCAMAGTVIAYDGEAGTVDVDLGVSSRTGRQLPTLLAVPVFLAGDWVIEEGDLCLVVFADQSIDDEMLSGTSLNPSKKMHSLSDGFAFVGFRRTVQGG